MMAYFSKKNHIMWLMRGNISSKINVFIIKVFSSVFRYCGNTTFGTIRSPSGTMQLKLKSADDLEDVAVAIGFSVDYETV